MAQRPGNKRHPCFCTAQCPPLTKPFLNYRIRIVGNTNFPTYDTWKLYTFDFADSQKCDWKPVEPSAGLTIERLQKRLGALGGHDHAYLWHLLLRKPGINQQWQLNVTWDDGEVVDENTLPSCQTLVMALDNFFLEPDAQLEAVPEWMCTDAQADAWPAS